MGPIRALGIALLLASAVASAPGTALAATFDVTTTADGADSNPGDQVCSAAGQCTLRAAVESANATAGFDEVRLPAGRYRLTDPGGDLDVTSDLAVTGTGQPFIDGMRSDRVFDVVDADLSLTGLTVARGVVSTGDYAGGGIRFTGGSGDLLYLLETVIEDNAVRPVGGAVTHVEGGGIAARGLGAEVVIESSEISYNVLDAQASRFGDDGVGGGLAVYDARAIVLNSRIADNEAVIAGSLGEGDSRGGGIWLRGSRSEPSVISGTQIVDNVAGNWGDGTGGGLMIAGVGGTVIADSVISRNRTVPEGDRNVGEGGGFAVTSDSRREGDLNLPLPEVVVLRTELTDNVAGSTHNGWGGGASVRGAEVFIGDSKVTGNVAAPGGADVTGSGLGGGIYSLGTLALDGSRVSANRTGGVGAPGQGGGIWGGGPLTINESVLSDNEAAGGAPAFGGLGGGLFAIGNAVLTDSAVTANSAGSHGSRGWGGGIVYGGGVQLYRSEVTGNRAGAGGSAGGGGLYAWADGASLLLDQSAVIDNSAGGPDAPGTGGGIHAYSFPDLINSTVSGNSVGGEQGRGGGVYFNGHELTLVAMTIASNSAPAGRGGNVALVGGEILARQTIIADGTAPGASGNCDLVPDSFVSFGFNLEDEDECGLNDPSDLTSTDPALSPLADHGGPTPTHAPARSGPAIDVMPDCSPLVLDQRGSPRPADGDGNGVTACDVGSVELGRVSDAASPGGDGEPTSPGGSAETAPSGGDPGDRSPPRMAISRLDAQVAWKEFRKAVEFRWECDEPCAVRGALLVRGAPGDGVVAAADLSTGARAGRAELRPCDVRSRKRRVCLKKVRDALVVREGRTELHLIGVDASWNFGRMSERFTVVANRDTRGR